MDTPTPTSAARDTNATSEFNAAFPPQTTVLGVRLLPLSLGRYRIMKWADVAFVSDEERGATGEDLFTAIAICGMTCADFKRLVSERRLEKEMHKWGKSLRKRIRKEKGFNLFEKFGLFKNYIEEGQKIPWVALSIQKDETTDYTHTHWAESVEVVLRGQLGWTKLEIEEEPLSKALTDYFKHMENQGNVRLMPHDLYAQMVSEGEANAAAFEKLAARQEATCPA